jgi:asparagine synthase (glutamine-hydrolysing)
MSRIVVERIGHALGLNPKAAGLLEFGGTYAGAYLLRRGLFMPWELARVLDPPVVRAGLERLQPLGHIAAELQPAPQSPGARVAVLESCLYMRNQLLRDADWASMAHSLEVRTPLVDSVLLSKVANLRVPMARAASKRLLANVPRRPLPQRVTEREKTGFGIPVGRWLLSKRSVAGTAQNYARQWACFVAGVAPHHPDALPTSA